jgi:hypothetical protein
MLAGMILSTLPHATSPAAPALTASTIAFYATSATIVPVLFIAIALQSPVWQPMLRNAGSAGRSARKNEQRVALIALHVPIVLAYLVLFAGLYGVGMSIGALSYDNDDPMRHDTVAAAVIILTIAVASVPLSQWSRALLTIWSSGRPESDDGQASAAQAPDKRPGAAMPETGKTGTT